MWVKKAKFCPEVLKLEGEFKASSSWLTRFRQCYGIPEKVLQMLMLLDLISFK
jgi:hypothetical protein